MNGDRRGMTYRRTGGALARPGGPAADVVNGVARMDTTNGALPVAVIIFFIGLILPFIIQIGPLRMSVYRLVLLIAVLPCMVMWLSGRAGAWRVPELALFTFAGWNTLAFVANHGVGTAIEPMGIHVIETLGAFLLGRVFIRSEEAFRKMVTLFFIIIVAMLPLALVESFTNNNITLQIFNAIYTSYYSFDMDPRWGLRRVQSSFEHPILFGVFCSAGVALAFFVIGYGRPLIVKMITGGMVVFTGLWSLSSGPLTAMAAQIGLTGWDTFFRSFPARWKILAGGFLGFVVLIEIVAARPSIQILISFVAFNKSTAFNRLRIWEWGSRSILNNPIFGIGQNEWVRAPFMPNSIDMFWIVHAVRHGLLSGLLLQVVVISVFVTVLKAKGLTQRAREYRNGYLIALMGLYIAGWTVHYWDAVYVLLMFLLGAGMWFVDAGQDTAETAETDRSTDRSTDRPAGGPERARPATAAVVRDQLPTTRGAKGPSRRGAGDESLPFSRGAPPPSDRR